MRTRQAIATYVAALAVACGMPTFAMADSRVVSSDGSATTDARDFWTQKRLREARPADGFSLPAPSAAFRLGSTPSSPEGPPVAVLPTRSTVPTAYDDAVTIGDTTPVGIRTHGKVFFKLEGRLFACSGTVVSSQNESTVWTAAHCLYQQRSQKFVKDLIFVPAYDEGKAPFGTWAAEQLYVSRKWTRRGPESSDFGSALMATDPAQKNCSRLDPPRRGQCKEKNRSATTIQDKVGSRGIAFNQPTNQTWTAYGYPVTPQSRFDGEHLEACTGKLKKTDPRQGSPAPIGIDCDMRGGASGGGWVINGDTVNGNVAYGYPQIDPNTVYSPYFGDAVKSFYGWIEDCPLLGCNFSQVPR